MREFYVGYAPNEFYDEKLYIMHYGRSARDGAPGRGSGRYPLGSGEHPRSENNGAAALRTAGKVGRALGGALLRDIRDTKNGGYRGELTVNGHVSPGWIQTAKSIHNVVGRDQFGNKRSAPAKVGRAVGEGVKYALADHAYRKYARQFEEKNGRAPTAEELQRVYVSARLPGLYRAREYESMDDREGAANLEYIGKSLSELAINKIRSKRG